jgi:hypothetical protein
MEDMSVFMDAVWDDLIPLDFRDVCRECAHIGRRKEMIS